ncbi:hypothetical protein KIH39_18350 [Telmatocola sphagniphila]|uniref:Uncharacterized protein n=1 Tax=Telmatocola sphagniphila TaxID=1123043 RepID=A0A8E6ESI5_9BACT|nr:hypothetical protein [Telmatocola sphagniphila]QVL30799.1 hypothetical protein KIH39_18350 [Telmatocola sphagniphila]
MTDLLFEFGNPLFPDGNWAKEKPKLFNLMVRGYFPLLIADTSNCFCGIHVVFSSPDAALVDHFVKIASHSNCVKLSNYKSSELIYPDDWLSIDIFLSVKNTFQNKIKYVFGYIDSEVWLASSTDNNPTYLEILDIFNILDAYDLVWDRPQ